MTKLNNLGLPHSTCLWIKDFLSNRSQRVKVGAHFSPALCLNTGSPQGCVLSSLLFTLYTYDCTLTYTSKTVVKFADDTTVVGLITGRDEAAYREEVEKLSLWCEKNNLTFNTTTLGVDFRRKRPDPQPIYINGDCVERVSNFKFLGLQLDDDLCWKTNTSALLKKAQKTPFSEGPEEQRSKELLISFYRCSG